MWRTGGENASFCPWAAGDLDLRFPAGIAVEPVDKPDLLETLEIGKGLLVIMAAIEDYFAFGIAVVEARLRRCIVAIMVRRADDADGM